MNLFTRIAIKNLQLPAAGLTAAEARALAVQEATKKPAKSTSDTTSMNGEQLASEKSDNVS